MKSYNSVEKIYTLSVEKYNQKISITEIFNDNEDDNIYAVGRLFKQFLSSMTFDDDIIDKILRLENLDD